MRYRVSVSSIPKPVRIEGGGKGGEGGAVSPSPVLVTPQHRYRMDKLIVSAVYCTNRLARLMEAHQQRGISLERSKNICIHLHVTELTLPTL
jgi:hypothetical protein